MEGDAKISIKNRKASGELVEVEGRTPQNALTVEIFTTLLTVFIAFANVATDYYVYFTIMQTTDQIANLPLPNPVSSVGMAASYNSSSDKSSLCNATFFSTVEGKNTLIDRLLVTKGWAFALFIISFLPIGIFAYFKLWVLYQRIFAGRRKEMAFDPVMNPTAPYIGKTAAVSPVTLVKKERVLLKQEFSVYVFLQLVEDTPQLMIIILFGIFDYGDEGARCAQCFAQETDNDITQCQVQPATFLSNSPIMLSLGLIITSIVWNYIHIFQRYYLILKAWDPPYSKAAIYIKLGLSTICYVSSIIFPISCLFYLYIGPELWGYPHADLQVFFTGMLVCGFFCLIYFSALFTALVFEAEQAMAIGFGAMCKWFILLFVSVMMLCTISCKISFVYRCWSLRFLLLLLLIAFTLNLQRLINPLLIFTRFIHTFMKN